MFNNIDELEREIQEFQQNIVASNKLIQTLQGVIEALKGQSADFKQSTAKLEADMKSATEDARTISSETVKAISDQSDEQLRKLLSELSKVLDDQKRSQQEQLQKLAQTESEFARTSEETVKEISEQNEVQIKKLLSELEKTVEEIKASQAEQIKKLESTEARLNGASAELEKKYADFLNRLETTNVDQIFQTCEQMKKSLETKLLLVGGGVGVAIILMVVSFFIK